MNRYLEKLAALTGMAKGLGNLGRGVGNILSDIKGGIGNQFHKATGGAYRDAVRDLPGMTEERLIAGHTGNFGTTKADKVLAAKSLRDKKIKDLGFQGTRQEQLRQYKTWKLKNGAPSEAQQLRDNLIGGRIATIAIVGGSVYGGKKLYEKVLELKDRYSQPQPQYEYYQ